MIIGRMLRKDFLRKKLITIAVFAFIFLSALMVASGTNLIIELSNSLNVLFTRANTPHFVQMHAGPLNQAKIDSWAAANELVTDQQTVEMITMDGSNLYLGESQNPEENSIMDISFVTQNEGFDFLLDLDNNIIQLSPGEIAVPVYYIQERGLAVGDQVIASAKADIKPGNAMPFSGMPIGTIIHNIEMKIGKGGHQPAAVRSTPRTDVDHPIGFANQIEVVLDHDDRVTTITQLMQDLKQFADVLRM